MNQKSSLKTFSSPVFAKTGEVSCPFCLKNKYRNYLNCDGFDFVKCECGFIYQRFMPSLSLIKEHYDDAYTQYEINNEISFLNLALHGLNDINFDNLESSLPDRSILDVGCATGTLLNYFKSKGYKTLGIEIDKHSAKLGQEKYGLDIFDLPIEECLIDNESFSLVHASHVIEHLRNPKSLVGEAFRILKKGGYFILTTPNTSSFQFHFFKNNWRSAISDHLVLFSYKMLKTMLEKNGFKVLNSKTWGGWPVNAKPAFLKKNLDKMAKYFHFGDVMIILAKKE